ncbi:bifunctional PIG-L family deacetylase/class I SAM-dependent methyltransferase [Rothia halotolerans]|uniref:bifunctional PIG-L family deacetylase/class I SAM-dependent methyltransferase n=1 Tax=Rothia halotolerans TaxID=405770 RepID=UPI00101DCFF2|nr:bifunctional PIG-L family deacetylase/class I SAM-dependent methyltransferase [Rothia halotolerans]
MSEPAFHGDAAAASTPAELRAFDAALPPWPVGSEDPLTGRWAPCSLPALIVLAPHPDDEVLGAAPLIVTALRAGAPVVVLAATEGEGSHPPEEIAAAELAAVRRRESQEALAVLESTFRAEGAPGIRRIPLDLPDGSLAGHEEEIAGAVLAAAEPLPRGAWLAATHPRDGHPDHEAVGRAAVRAAEARRDLDLVHVPVWLWHHAKAGEDPSVEWDLARTIPVDPAMAQARVEAMRRFSTQLDAGLGRAVDRPAGAPVITEHALETMWRERFVLFPAAAMDFASLYRESEDPWAVDGRWYEQRKFELTTAMLPRRRFRRAYEPGCSSGWLTARLAERCEEVLASDVVPSAVRTARQRVPAANVEFREGAASEVPEGPLDLVVLSELGYYLSEAEFAAFRERTRGALAPDGFLIAVHWRHPIEEAHRTAEQVHRALAETPGWIRHASYRDEDVLIEVFGPPGPSVAEAEFLGTADGEREAPARGG